MNKVRALVLLTGACVLVIEILGSRLVSPFYGSTRYVWSAMLCGSLAALAAGYWAGGRLAARWSQRLWPALGGALGAAGIWLLAVIGMRKTVLIATSGLGV